MVTRTDPGIDIATSRSQVKEREHRVRSAVASAASANAAFRLFIVKSGVLGHVLCGESLHAVAVYKGRFVFLGHSAEELQAEINLAAFGTEPCRCATLKIKYKSLWGFADDFNSLTSFGKEFFRNASFLKQARIRLHRALEESKPDVFGIASTRLSEYNKAASQTEQHRQGVKRLHELLPEAVAEAYIASLFTPSFLWRGQRPCVQDRLWVHANWYRTVFQKELAVVERYLILAVYDKKQLEHDEHVSRVRNVSGTFWDKIISKSKRRELLDSGILPALGADVQVLHDRTLKPRTASLFTSNNPCKDTKIVGIRMSDRTIVEAI